MNTRRVSRLQQLPKHLYNPLQSLPLGRQRLKNEKHKMNNRRDSRKNTKTDIKANRKSFFPVNMQLSQLEQPKEFVLLFGIDVFYFNSCLMLMLNTMIINTNKTTLSLITFVSPSWQHPLKVSKSGEIGWVTQMQLLATLSAYPHYSLFCHAGPGGHRPLKSSSSTLTLNDCNTQSFILYHKTANSPIYSFSKHVSHTELNLASHRI